MWTPLRPAKAGSTGRGRRLLPPMIGRTGESALLAEMWEQSAAGSGRVGVISGEPGIGKSRLIREFRSSLDAISASMFCRYQCSPFHVNTPLAPEIERLRRASAHSGSRRRASSHWQNCARCWQEPSPMSSTLFATTEPCCRYPACAGYEPADLGSPSERERAFQVIIDVLIAASRKRPILVIVEDVQWIDPTSIELLRRVIARCHCERILILITHRDDYNAELVVGLRQFNGLLCKNWQRTNASRWWQPSLAAGFVPRRIISQIVERTDGVPLFIEEFTRSVVDSGAVSSRGRQPRAEWEIARTPGAGKYSRFADGAP